VGYAGTKGGDILVAKSGTCVFVKDGAVVFWIDGRWRFDAEKYRSLFDLDLSSPPKKEANQSPLRNAGRSVRFSSHAGGPARQT
jgi:hypothetical protein